MAEKKLKARKTAGSTTTKRITESAHQIWLAGLGAYAKAQEEGGRLFEALVKEGEGLETRTREQVQDQIDAARDRVEAARTRATGNWDKLEKVFEDRVARALRRLGVPMQDDIDALALEIAELKERVELLGRDKPKAAPRKKRAPAKPKPAETKGPGGGA